LHRLHLLRHAKSSWDEGIEDRERSLNRRGREEAERVGADLPGAVGPLDLVLCSPARRTRETAALVLAGFDPALRIVFDDVLYLAGAGALFERLRRLDEGDGSVMVIGHNPGLHELAVALVAADSADYAALASGKFSTAARATLAIPGTWSTLAAGANRLTGYVTVKSLKS